jgi:dephospho-CoA kinase
MTTGLVISFSGRIASGKTHITQLLARSLSWPRASFGDYLRVVLAERGIADPTREALQELGRSFVDADPNGFCRNVLAQVSFVPGGSILLDGIRHIDIQRRVEVMVRPSRAFLIHLAAEDDVVAQRVRRRGASEQEFRRADRHQVEGELRQSLPELADFVIDASLPVENVLSECLAVLENCGVDAELIERARNLAADRQVR